MKIICSTILALLLSSPVWAATQEAQVKEANELFKKKQWDSAVDLYLNALDSNQHTDIVQYDLGTAFYKKGNYDQSIEHLQKAVSDKNKTLSSKAYYNMGNALYQKGRSLENDKIDEAIDALQKSLVNYDQTLRLTPKDKDAKYNQDVVEKELERLKKKKEDQQKKQRQQQDKKDKQDKSGQNKDKQQSSQDQQKQGNQKQEQNNEQSSSDQQKKDGKKANEDEQNSKKKDEQKKQEAQKQKEQSKSGKEQKESGQEQQDQEAQPQTAEEKQAKEMLEEYERQDAPKGLLNFVDRHKGESHVERDW